MKFCFNCGQQLEDDAVFCNQCGAQQPNAGATVQAPVEQKKPVNQAGYVTKNVIAGEDGKYRWAYEMSLFRDMWVLGTILKIFGGIILAGGVIFLIIELFGDHNYLEVIKTVGIMAAIMGGLSFLGYFVYALIMGGKYCVVFTMDDKGILHEQQPKQAKKASIIGDLLILAGAATGNLTTIGIGMSSAKRTAMHTTFKGTKKITSIKRKRTIRLDSPMDHNRVWCEKDDFDFVWNYIKDRCEGAQVIVR